MSVENGVDTRELTAQERREARLDLARQTRQSRLQRFNFWRLYLPLGIMVVLVLAVGISLTWLALIPETAAELAADSWVSFISAGADLTIILFLLPLVVFCSLIPTAALIYTITASRRGWSVYRFIQRQLHFVENQVTLVHEKSAESTPVVARGVAIYRGALTRVVTIVKNIWVWIAK